MSAWIENSLVTGGVATAATTLAAAACGEAELGRPLAPINAVSHILWGDEAARANGADASHTITGLALNAAAVTSWAVVHELLFAPSDGKRDLGCALLGGAAVSALAYVTDYHVVPDRLTPGFEKRLSGRSLFGIYASLALGLAIGRLLGKSD